MNSVNFYEFYQPVVSATPTSTYSAYHHHPLYSSQHHVSPSSTSATSTPSSSNEYIYQRHSALPYQSMTGGSVKGTSGSFDASTANIIPTPALSSNSSSTWSIDQKRYLKHHASGLQQQHQYYYQYNHRVVPPPPLAISNSVAASSSLSGKTLKEINSIKKKTMQIVYHMCDFPTLLTQKRWPGRQTMYPLNIINTLKRSSPGAQHRHLKLDLIEYAAHLVSKLFPYEAPTAASNSMLPSVTHFIKTIFTKTRISITTLVCAMFYLSKLKKYHPVCKGSKGSSQKLMLAAIMVASKYLYDDTFDNKAWSTVSGIFKVEDINKMEIEFLSYIDWRMHITWEEWREFCIETTAAIHLFFQSRGEYGKRFQHDLVWELCAWDEFDEEFHHANSGGNKSSSVSSDNNTSEEVK